MESYLLSTPHHLCIFIALGYLDIVNEYFFIKSYELLIIALKVCFKNPHFNGGSDKIIKLILNCKSIFIPPGSDYPKKPTR